MSDCDRVLVVVEVEEVELPKFTPSHDELLVTIEAEEFTPSAGGISRAVAVFSEACSQVFWASTSPGSVVGHVHVVEEVEDVDHVVDHVHVVEVVVIASDDQGCTTAKPHVTKDVAVDSDEVNPGRIVE